MEREKLLQEYEATLDSLIEKTKFVYSEDFYELDDFEKQKYTKDKLATEGHLNTLCSLLWSNTPQFGNVSDFISLGIISSMFGGWNKPFGADYPKTQLEEKDFSEEK